MIGARLRAVLRVIAINAGILALGIVVIEVTFGQWFAARPGYAMLRIVRDVELMIDVSKAYPGGGVAVHRRDRFGLRGAYDDPSRIDIIAIGGSTTNELYIGEGETWTDVLAASFRSEGRPYSVVNAGIEGQSTVGHLLNFDLWFSAIPGMKARYVIAYVGLNDMHTKNPTIDDHLHVQSFWRSLRSNIRDRSALYRTYRVAVGMQQARTARLVHGRVRWDEVQWVEQPFPAVIVELQGVDAKRRDEYGTRLGQLISRIRQFGAEAIIVTQRHAGYRRVGDRLLLAKSADIETTIDVIHLQRAFNARAMEVCRAHKAICIDLAEELDMEPGDFYDAGHATPKGARRIGVYLHEKLKDVIR